MKQSTLIIVAAMAAAFLPCLLRRTLAETASAFRPPAVPLVTCDPYLSVWSFNDRLTDGDTHHWTGKPQTLISLVRIDGKAYRIMGAQPASARRSSKRVWKFSRPERPTHLRRGHSAHVDVLNADAAR